MNDNQLFDLSITIRHAEDLPGVWVSHCLEFDTVSQGHSPNEATEMILEATSMVIIDDLEKGFDLKKRRAPDEYFLELKTLSESAKTCTINKYRFFGKDLKDGGLNAVLLLKAQIQLSPTNAPKCRVLEPALIALNEKINS